MIQTLWYQRNLSPLLRVLSKCLVWILAPLSAVYYCIVIVRRYCYQHDFFAKHEFSLPIIVIGNITVGGTGKTPLVIHVVNFLKQQGLNPGIISRGYQGNYAKINTKINNKTNDGNNKTNYEKTTQVCQVFADSDPLIVGDEPLLLANRLSCPVIVSRKRALAVKALVELGTVDVIISDDGLQHYALERDIEVAVIDGKHRFGNGWCLPAGPLRESVRRLDSVDFLVANGSERFDNDSEYDMELKPRNVINGKNPSIQHPLSFFQGKTVYALAGIGFPDRFFDTLKAQGIQVIPCAFPDHYAFKKEDIYFGLRSQSEQGRENGGNEELSQPDLPVLMTEKDAVKCREFMSDQHWIVRVEAVVNPLFDLRLLKRLQEIKELKES